MILAALALLCCSSISADTPRVPETPLGVELESSSLAEPASKAEPSKPEAPAPKSASNLNSEVERGPGAGSSSSAIEPGLKAPVKPAIAESYETPRQRKIWYGLMAASHGSAAFDAWTTRRAISGGYGVEGDPLQRPFAQSGAIYATTQVMPLITDYLGHRMVRSSHPWMRRIWWVPQVASASVSLGAGIHNYGLVR